MENNRQINQDAAEVLVKVNSLIDETLKQVLDNDHPEVAEYAANLYEAQKLVEKLLAENNFLE